MASGARWSASPIVQRRVWFVVVGATRRTIYLGHTLPTATTSLRLSNANIVSEIVRRRDMSGRGNFATINPLVTLARERGLADNGERSVRFLRSISTLRKLTETNITNRLAIFHDRKRVCYYTLSYTDQSARIRGIVDARHVARLTYYHGGRISNKNYLPARFGSDNWPDYHQDCSHPERT